MLLLLLRAALCGHCSEYWKFSKNSIQVDKSASRSGWKWWFPSHFRMSQFILDVPNVRLEIRTKERVLF